MQTSLIIMCGVTTGHVPLTKGWKEHVEALRRTAVPVLAARVDSSSPAVLLDVEQHPLVETVLAEIRDKERMPEFWAVWCTFFASDRSIAESFLLITMNSPSRCQFALNFRFKRHWALLEELERTGQLAIYTASAAKPALLDIAVPDLHMHLARLRTYQPRRRISPQAHRKNLVLG